LIVFKEYFFESIKIKSTRIIISEEKLRIEDQFSKDQNTFLYTKEREYPTENTYDLFVSCNEEISFE